MSAPADGRSARSTSPSPDGRSARSTSPGWWARLTRSRTEDEAAHLRELSGQEADPTVRRIDCCTPGEPVVIRGLVRSLTMPAQGSTPSVEIEIDDGSGYVRVIWLGRRRIPGIEAGRTMVVRGRLTCNTDHPTIYNPRYELKPTSA